MPRTTVTRAFMPTAPFVTCPWPVPFTGLCNHAHPTTRRLRRDGLLSPRSPRLAPGGDSPRNRPVLAGPPPPLHFLSRRDASVPPPCLICCRIGGPAACAAGCRLPSSPTLSEAAWCRALPRSNHASPRPKTPGSPFPSSSARSLHDRPGRRHSCGRQAAVRCPCSYRCRLWRRTSRSYCGTGTTEP